MITNCTFCKSTFPKDDLIFIEDIEAFLCDDCLVKLEEQNEEEDELSEEEAAA